MSGVRAHLQLAVLLAIGLAAGIWTFVAPWALGYPGAGAVAWTRPIWSNVIVGAVMAVTSAAALVTVLALMAHTGRRRGGAEGHPGPDAT